jgi:ribosomal protein S18 acetylase RimI-like enzyme
LLNNSIDNFEILTFKDENRIQASIFANKGKDLTDIVGLFIDERSKQKGIENILINELFYQISEQYGEIREVLYFVEEENKGELEIALDEGFQIKEEYNCFEKKM